MPQCHGVRTKKNKTFITISVSIRAYCMEDHIKYDQIYIVGIILISQWKLSNVAGVFVMYLLDSDRCIVIIYVHVE